MVGWLAPGTFLQISGQQKPTGAIGQFCCVRLMGWFLVGRIEIETAKRRWFGIGSLFRQHCVTRFFRRRIEDTLLKSIEYGSFPLVCGSNCSDTGLHASFGWTWKVSTTGWPVGYGCGSPICCFGLPCWSSQGRCMPRRCNDFSGDVST